MMARFAKVAFRIVALDTALALIPPLLLLAVLRDMTCPRFVDCFKFSFVYANCIGTLAHLAVPRTWIASERINTWLRWALRAAVIFAASVAGALIACGVFVALHWIPADGYWAEFSGSLKMATFITVFAASVISMYESFHTRLEETKLQLRTNELERERALKLATEAQLASLESRIHPHFLFNALNSISALIPVDPARAERLVEQMAALLRFSLDSNHAGLVPLDREMKIVSDYLMIEQARFGDRLRFRIDGGGEIGGAKVPPLAIQTLVENSVKHAVSRSRAGGEIQVRVARENGWLQVLVRDEGPEFTLESAPSGHGLDILKGRLDALYGARGGISVQRHGGSNEVTLSVPQNGDAHARIPG